jgi:sodium/bile acid cotransporter 7|tara:strand:+ start:872 stop:1957 length:1086 start_codon:yes stop_codon:yes gene_type:complete
MSKAPLTFFGKHWFLVSLVALVGGGLAVGLSLSQETVDALDSQQGAGAFLAAAPGWITRIVLFLMAFSLNSGKLREALRFPLPVLWASLVNIVAIPLAGWGLMGLQGNQSFAVGLVIATSVPCTMAAVSVWTRKAGGNDAVSLLTTLLTNSLCFVVTPFWLNLATSDLVGSSAELGIGAMTERLLYVVLVPSILGQLARSIPAVGRFAVAHKARIGIIAQGLILVLVFTASALKAGPQLKSGSLGLGAIAIVWVCCLAIHLAAMLLGGLGARLMGFSREDRIAVLFGSSQKTLPIGVLLATDPRFGIAAVCPFAVFPMLMFHATQLFVDTIIAARIAARAAEQEPGSSGAEAAKSDEPGSG